MTVTDRDLLILRALRRYKFLTTAQLRDLVVPSDLDGRITRDRLGKLRKANLARTLQAQVVSPLATSNAPVWLPTEAGCNLLAARTGDTTLLLDAQPGTDAWQHLAHYVAVSQFHILLDAVIAAQDRVRMNALYFEHDVIRPHEQDPSKKYRLYTDVSTGEKRTVCCPDSAFELQVGEYRRAYLLELERGTDTPARVAAKKSPGYAGLATTEKWRTLFPHARDFAVLTVCPNAGWRDALRREVARHASATLWRFAATDELTKAPPEQFFTSPLFFTCEAGPLPFAGGSA